MTISTASLRVLYLEDNPADADLTRRELARQAPEMRLEIATTLGAALERLAPASPPYDLVLSDLSLPDCSGLELLAHIRQRKLPLAVVIITGSGDQEAAVVALKAGADDYLVKRTGQTGTLPRVLSAAYTSYQLRRERRAKPLRVLYAEPNPFDCDLTRRYLAQHAPHIHLEVVGSGDELLTRLPVTTGGTGQLFDLLLLDYRLPGLNALEVIKAVRQERGLDIPIVLVTGQGNEEVAVQALRLGVNDYLVKNEGYLQQLPVVLEKVQKQAELNMSEERYRCLFENNHAVMLVLDPESGEVVDANPAATAWYGWSREELCRKNIREINTLPLDKVLSEIERARSQQDWHFFFQHRRADGSVRDVEVFSGPVAVAGRPLLYSIVQDITEKKQAEEALLESEVRLRLSVAASNIGLWDWDLVTNKIYFSPEWKNQLGYTEDEIPNHFEEWQSRIHPDDLAPALAKVQSFIADPSSKYATEFRLRHKDGSYRWIFSQGQIFFDTAGKPARMMGCHIDITDQKKLETQYLHAQKMESIGTLAGGVAHDFNNILTVIVGLGEMTLMKMAGDNPQRGNIEGILEAAKRATHLTKELLLFSRKQDSERRRVDLNSIINKTEKFLSRIIGEDIALKQVPHGSSLPVLADNNQLEQVLMNLAINARDAMPQGGEFILRTEEVVLDEAFIMTYGYGQPGPYALLTVSDTGTGMDKATQQRIFEPFFSTKEVGKGTGLGLSVVYGIIKQHDGFITVASEPGEGSTFRIYLPLTKTAQPEPGAEEGQPVAGGTETILLAEDNDLVREMVTSVLTEAGYTVIVAVDGAEAVCKFRENAGAIQLLLFDLIMPKMNGKVAADEIHKLQPAMKTIFASGYAPDTAQQKAALDDGSHLVYKPISPRDLLKKVRDVLDDGTHK